MWDEQKIIATAFLGYYKKGSPSYESDKHISHLYISVDPDYRRQGLAGKLLSILYQRAIKREEAKTIFSETSTDEGRAFSEKFGGKLSIEGSENRLMLAEVDWKLMEQWKNSGEALAKMENIQIKFFEQCPADIIEEYTAMYEETMNQQPLGSYDGKITINPETRRYEEEKVNKRGYKWYTFYTCESDSTISGMTEMFYHPSMGHKIVQNLTSVKEKYRGRGLGKWLKAHMLFWIDEKYPDIRYISTGNASSNKPMLSINERMGFRRFKSGAEYVFSIDEIGELI